MKNWVGLSKSSNIKVDLVDTGLMLGHKVSNFKESTIQTTSSDHNVTKLEINNKIT